MKDKIIKISIIITITILLILILLVTVPDIEIQYIASKGGKIAGKSQQLIKKGKDAEEVIAIADDHFNFISWSDGLKSPTRKDKRVKSNLKVTAQFERKLGDFRYNYNNATANNTDLSILLNRGDINNVKFIVPTKEYFNFNGWYLDKELTIPVSDDCGNIVIGDEVFNVDECNIYAKWTVKERTFYKILIVYDTVIKADLDTIDGSIIKVDYKMTGIERQLCSTMTRQFSKYLNEMMEGLVTFEIDEYFTTVPLGRENITETIFGEVDHKVKNWNINPDNIPEVQHKYNDYRSVINVFSFNDYESKLRSYSGHGGEKFAAIHFESLVAQAIADKYSFNDLLDVTNKDWENILSIFAHEFTHTVEQGITTYRFHNASANYYSQGIYDSYQIVKDYLLNKAKVTDYEETVGIPYYFWKEEIYTLRYDESKGGYVDFAWPEKWQSLISSEQYVPRYSRGTKVIAIALAGYRFSHWSDGITTESRIDYNIQSDTTITAIFEPLPYEVRYNASEGGRIEGDEVQIVLCDEYSQYVTAVANEGYRFIGWSDGNKNQKRCDVVYRYRLGLQVTALFEKIS